MVNDNKISHALVSSQGNVVEEEIAFHCLFSLIALEYYENKGQIGTIALKIKCCLLKISDGTPPTPHTQDILKE
jgi:hypothetical protein